MILVRCINYLKKNFKNQKLKQKCNNITNLNSKYHLENEFYSFYFREESLKQNIPIENFFAFKNCSHKKRKNIPTSITKKVIRLWMSNPSFIEKILNHLNSDFLKDFKEFNKRKIYKLIALWNTKIQKKGHKKAIKIINKSLSKTGCKLPWLLPEIKFGI